MGLVDYSDSDSEAEVQPKVPAKEVTKATASKPFQKFVDRSNPGKILVSLPTAAAAASSKPEQQPSDEPPAKRARTAGGSRFSGFSSFLPPPKKTATPALSSNSGSGGKVAPRPGVHLKTGVEPAFSREQSGNEDYGGDGSSSHPGGGGGGGLKLPPPKNHSTGSASGPSIPEDQKPAEEVKLVGKPLMFKPLSVSRRPGNKKKTSKPSETGGSASPQRTAGTLSAPAPQPEPPKKAMSLFSIGAEAESPAATESPSAGAYEPLFSSSAQEDASDAVGPTAYDDYSTPAYPEPAESHLPQPSAPSLSSMASDLNLSAQARRELFGRDGRQGGEAARVVSFDMSREYEHNEAVRRSGEAATHNPVRSIKAGKHSLRQLVNAVQSNASALEESFAAQKGKKNEAGARYGWR